MSSNRIKSEEIQVGDNYVLPIEQSRVTRQQAKVQQIIDETDAKAQQIIANAENKSQVVIQTANTEAEAIIENAKKKAEKEKLSRRLCLHKILLYLDRRRMRRRTELL